MALGLPLAWHPRRPWRRTGVARGSWWPVCPGQDVESEVWDWTEDGSWLPVRAGQYCTILYNSIHPSLELTKIVFPISIH